MSDTDDIKLDAEKKKQFYATVDYLTRYLAFEGHTWRYLPTVYISPTPEDGGEPSEWAQGVIREFCDRAYKAMSLTENSPHLAEKMEHVGELDFYFVVKKKLQIEELKTHWEQDPHWDLGDEMGLEHTEELEQHQKEYNTVRDKEYHERKNKQAAEWGCTPELVTHISIIEYEIERLRKDLNTANGDY